jgi:hypothetical protein
LDAVFEERGGQRVLLYVVLEDLQASAKLRLVHDPKGRVAGKLIPAVVIAAEMALYESNQPRREIGVWTRSIQLQ